MHDKTLNLSNNMICNIAEAKNGIDQYLINSKQKSLKLNSFDYLVFNSMSNKQLLWKKI